MTAGAGTLTLAHAVPAPGMAARDVAVRDSSGKAVHLAELWIGAPNALILVLLRHYGCPLCRAHISDLKHDYQRLTGAGATVAVIGQGTPEQAAAFVAEMRLPFPVLADADRSTYAAYGLAEGTLGQLFSLETARRVVNRFLRGHAFGRIAGNIWQLPGTFIIDTNGIVRFSHPGQHAADTPTADELIAAMDR